jgi:hypothetical protein
VMDSTRTAREYHCLQRNRHHGEGLHPRNGLK